MYKVYKIYFCTFIFFVFFKSFVLAQEIYINEFQASNGETYSDDAEEYDDWIELYNAGDSAISLDGLYISDDFEDLARWQFPESLLIGPKSYRVFWADNQPEQGQDHLEFKLSDNGEQIILSRGDSSSIIDQIEFGQQYLDISYGRHPDSLDKWYYFSEPTPGKINSDLIFTNKSTPPTIMLESGYYNSAINVEIITNDTSLTILYTTNSSIPTDSNSYKYTGPIPINSTTVIRAVTKKQGFLYSDVITRSFIYEQPPSLPTVYLVTDSLNMWGPTGIYKYRSNDLEKPVHFEFYNQNNNERYQSDAGIKIHAPDGRPQQSFRLLARSSYGNKYFNHKFFDQKDITKFKRLVLRNGGNDGLQIADRTHIRDMVMQKGYFERNNQNAISAWKSVNVYLNGMYWGIYNLRERQDEYYIQENYPYDGELDLLERAFGAPGNRYVLSGSWLAYDEMRIFINDYDMGLTENYNYVEQLMDVDDFAEYWIFEVFYGNFDWLLNNIRFWKVKNSESKWRWMMWDMDHGLGLEYQSYGEPDWNTLDWSTSTTGERTGGGSNNILIRNLLENEEFKNKFINLFADLLNSTFKPTNMYRIIDELANNLDPDVPKNSERWTANSYSSWKSAVQSVRNYAAVRPGYVREHIISKFNLTGSYTLNLSMNFASAGTIKVNTLNIKEKNWQGDYFNNVPLPITVKARKGYLFDHWTVDTSIVKDETLFITGPSSITANFVVDTIPEVIVNEINYHSADEIDSGDWIELYNPKVFDLDISGWTLKDNDDEHFFTFPANTKIDSNSYLVVCRELEDFKKFFPEITNVIGDLNFGLDNSSDQIRIYRENGELIDSVEYMDDDPWPDKADGEGYTLELMNISFDNSVAENWNASKQKGGTPGQENGGIILNLKSLFANQPKDFILWQNYPNPFNATTRIDFYVPRNEKLNISVFNSQGQFVEKLVDNLYLKGKHSVIWDANKLSSGIYFIRQTTRNSAKTIKSLLIK